MRPSAEIRAALVLLGVALLGAAVRGCGSAGAAPGAVWSQGEGRRPQADTVAARAARRTRPLAPGERVDINTATVGDLARLPRIGPALAARILAVRDSLGGFGSLEALGRVPGIGPATLRQLEPHVRVGGTVRSARAAPSGVSGRVPVNRASVELLQTLPGVGPVLAHAIIADRRAHGPYRTPEDLARVRGVGPALVERLRGRILLP